MAHTTGTHGPRDTHAEHTAGGTPGAPGAQEFRLPDLGEGLTEAEIVHWLVEVGDVVAVDQPVVEVETAKAVVEVPCPYGGVITARFGEEGTELPVGAPLLTVAADAPAGGARKRSTDKATGQSASEAPTEREAVTNGETAGDDAREGGVPGGRRGGRFPGGGGAAGDRHDDGGGTGAGGESGNVLVGYGTAAAPARRRRLRPPDGRAPGGTPPKRPGGTPGSRPSPRGADAVTGAGTPPADRAGAGTVEARPAHGSGPVPVISPLVRKLARDHHVDLRALSGSGPDGLILRSDVEHAIRAAAHTSAAPKADSAAPVADPAGVARPVTTAAGAPQPGTEAPTGPRRPAPGLGAGTGAVAAGERIPLRGVRGAIADKMVRSHREIPDATCWVDADATELLHTRTVLNETGGPKVSLLALLGRICTAALARYPELNATVDAESREVVRLREVHLGFAAQTERGLVVPVVRNAHRRDVESLSQECARLSEAARAGTLAPAQLTGGTFTLNNYGVFGVDGATPILNHPEAAMLGVGRITPKPWVHRGELAVRHVVQLSLTFDHRVCDGGTAGGFLRYVADCVAQPAVLLRHL